MAITPTPKQTYGFIGLGAMGYWMAGNLRVKIPSDSVLCIYDIAGRIMTDFEQEFGSHGQIIICASPGEVVNQSHIIISIVPEGKHVQAVFAEDNGGALSVSDVAGKLFIECSTIDVATSTGVAERVAARGAVFVDAPVSGGTIGAKAGTLTFMVGMDEFNPDYQRIRPVLETMAKNTFPCGGPTLGLSTKLCNNYVSGTIAIATAEGMNLAMKLGLNPKMFSDVMKVSTGGSYINSFVNPVPGVDPAAPSSNDYAPGFKIQLMRKDYNLAVEAAKSVGATLHLGDKGLEVFTGAANDPNCVDRDCRVVFRYIGGNERWQ